MYKYFFIVAVVIAIVGCNNEKLFEEIDSSHSGIHFNNLIVDNDTVNVMDVENIYNGGGVGIGDFNNDGLPDIYFSGNQVNNELYINEGNFRFKNVTKQAGVDGEGKWCRGVSVVDINNDGLLDVYVCASILQDGKKRENLLYINTGIDKEKVPHFKNMAREYGLDDSSHSTMAAFFDYDNDGDLDMYLLINEVSKSEYPNKFRAILKNGEHPDTDKLFRNDGTSKENHPVFTNVSKEAGITIEGYGHGVNIVDINQDGWKDIYVTNDFLPNNILYINNHDGTFTDEVRKYFKHTSANSMGQDVIDINNDGLVDVIELDMNPEDNYRKKLMLNSIGYQNYINSDYYGYQYQYVRNVLQLNQGPRVLANDSTGEPVFSDVGFYSGIAQTDWSWAPVVTDFDNDGYRDIIITNGFPKDITDHDFIAFRNKAYYLSTKRELLDQVPEVKIANYAYKNNGDVTFSNVTKQWGMDQPCFSNGAVYADLDNDGDMDVVVNNINGDASLYRNNTRKLNKANSNYLEIKFSGSDLNKNGLGAVAELHYDKGKIQEYENTPYRGYLSSYQTLAHFGLGSVQLVDSVIIKWPDSKMQLLLNVKANQTLTVNINDANLSDSPGKTPSTANTLFRDVSESFNIDFTQEERDFVDFNIQKLLPHKLSEYGPALAAGDIDGNGLDDIICGGPNSYSAQIFFQQPGNRFIQKPLLNRTYIKDKKEEDTGLLLFDADGDDDPDLYIASGSYENEPGSKAYQDRFYINDGKGNFIIDTGALPVNLTSKFCVRGADYDKDGDMDLFVAGRVSTGKYPEPVSSFILRNDSKRGNIKFTDVTAEVAKDLINVGLVCDALFTDFDNDGWTDLILAGEWMPLTFLKNKNGRYVNVTASSGLQKEVGWWNTIAAGDFDNDGDIDYIAGNLGQNSFYKASEKYPIAIYADDFDSNGSYDAFPALYLPPGNHDTTLKLFSAQTRDDVIKQMISMRAKYKTYKSFAVAPIDEMFTPDQLKKALILKANNLNSCFIRNLGNGKFSLQVLPMQAQFSALNGIAVDDMDGDGNLDCVTNANDYGTEVSVGRYDALNGLLMKGDGKGNFFPQTILQSGIYIPGNGKALVKLRNKNEYLLAASQNRGALKLFKLKQDTRSIPLRPADAYATIQYKNGKTQRQEFYYGASFLSQSARFINLNNNVTAVAIYDTKGVSRKVSL